MKTSKQVMIGEDLIQAYMDYRKFHYEKIAEVLQTIGLISQLRTAKTLDEIIVSRNFIADRKPALKAMLQALVELNVLEQVNEEEFIAIQSHEFGEVDLNKIERASGSQAIEQHSNIASLAVGFLDGSKGDIEFSYEFSQFWKALLEAPFYAQGRQKSTESVANRVDINVLDLASGQGHALVELARLVGEDGLVNGIEYSQDHIEISKKLIQERGHQNIEVIQGDLNNGLPYENQKFDGVLFIGALHFITKREELIHEISRVTRPGAVVAIGNIYSNLSTFDKPFMDLIFSMIQPRAIPVNLELLHQYFKDASLTVTDNINVGCNAWYLLRKDR